MAVIVVVMGVAGTGKTTVGQALAARLGWPFADADAYHSPAAVAKMARGEGLADADRAPWLGRLRALVEAHLADGRPLVLACSALRQAHRDALARPGEPVRFVWLDAPPETLADRLGTRTGHFAAAALLGSQLATLEPPEDALRLDAREPPAHLVGVVVHALGLGA
jgi:gluconokinase